MRRIVSRRTPTIQTVFAPPAGVSGKPKQPGYPLFLLAQTALTGLDTPSVPITLGKMKADCKRIVPIKRFSDIQWRCQNRVLLDVLLPASFKAGVNCSQSHLQAPTAVSARTRANASISPMVQCQHAELENEENACLAE